MRARAGRWQRSMSITATALQALDAAHTRRGRRVERLLGVSSAGTHPDQQRPVVGGAGVPQRAAGPDETGEEIVQLVTGVMGHPARAGNRSRPRPAAPHHDAGRTGAAGTPLGAGPGLVHRPRRRPACRRQARTNRGRDRQRRSRARRRRPRCSRPGAADETGVGAGMVHGPGGARRRLIHHCGERAPQNTGATPTPARPHRVPRTVRRHGLRTGRAQTPLTDRTCRWKGTPCCQTPQSVGAP